VMKSYNEDLTEKELQTGITAVSRVK